jgi:predicted GNAT superfamily acetyltransferase
LPHEYVIDMYGEQTGSDLHSGLGTDRFVVEWKFGDPELSSRLARGAHWSAPVPATGDSVVTPAIDVEGVMATLARDLPEAFWVEIPKDIERLKAEDRARGLLWRDAMRRSMVWAFAHGYRVSGIAGDLRSGEKVWYRLERE